MLFSRLILRPLLTQRLRSLVTILGVALGVAVMLGIQLANSASLRGFSSALNAVSGKASLEIACPPAGLDENQIPGLSWLRQWGIATPVIEAEVLAETAHGSEMLKVIGIDALRDPALRDYALLGQEGEAAGTQLLSVLAVPNTLILTHGFAARHGLTQGSSLRLIIGDRALECHVAAVIGEGEGTSASLSAQPLAVMDIAYAQDLLGRTGKIDRLELRLHEGVSLESAEQGLRQRLPSGWTVQRPQRRTEAVEKMLAAFHFNLTMLSGIALVVGLFLIYNTVSVSVMTRRAEIGMLRTLGVTRGQILRLFLGEAVVLAMIGAVLGVPLAKGLAAAAVALTSTTVETLYVAQSAVVPELTVLHWFAGFIIALPLALVAAARPALEAANISPVEAIAEIEPTSSATVESRGRASFWRRLALLVILILGSWCAMQPPLLGLPLWGYASAFCAIVAATLVVPGTLIWTANRLRSVLGKLGIEGRLAASQISASHRRLSVSVAALAVSLALTIAIAVMVGSFRETVILWVDQTLGADLYVRPAALSRSANPPSLSPATIAAMHTHPQVLAVEAHRSMELPFRDRQIRLSTGDFEVMLQHGRMVFKSGGDSAATLRAARTAGELLASESFALRFQVNAGSSIQLNTPNGPHEFRIAAIFYDYSNDRGTLTMDQSLFAKYFGESQPTHMAIYLKPGADAEQVRDEILRSLSGKARLMIFTNASLRAEVLKVFDSTFAITWALEIIAVFVAMAGVAATMLTLVLERQKEMRLLRLAGADAAQVRRTIVIESGLLGLVGQGLGIAVGMLLSLVLIHVINPQSFGWSMQLHVPWLFLAASTLLTLFGTMLAGLYPAWRITRQSLRA
ncbi:MAG: FtsX-like permease family protein [Prosthecobacter sp.]|nr:FtsX-like permease family protein [Prosthecobacter sp.]